MMAITVADRDDTAQFKPLIGALRRNVAMAEVSADRAYS